ncbi:MAG TPA: Clp protease N-terminal domain-containing protein [Armatimonadota bacterium]|nr:Clp protease N-terminal domain-containing protein [Armatimonadota bacterium]
MTKRSELGKRGISFGDVISKAAVLADNEGEKLVTPAHLLLAIMARADPVAIGALRQLAPDVEKLSKSLDDTLRAPARPMAEEPSLQRLAKAVTELMRSVTPEQRSDEPAMQKLLHETIEKCGPRPRLSQEAKQVWRSAEQEAQQSGAEMMEAEHILLGLLADPGNEAAQALKASGITLELARSAVSESRRANAHPAPPLWRTLENSVLHLLAAARNRVRGSGRDVVTLKDILLALVDDNELGTRLATSFPIDRRCLRRSIETLPPPAGGRQSQDGGPRGDVASEVGSDTRPAGSGGWLDPRTCKALEFAAQEAHRFSRIMVGPADLLAGIIAVSDEEELDTLRLAGLDLSKARDILAANENGGPEISRKTPPDAHVSPHDGGSRR